MQLYADEGFPKKVTDQLREFGYDVLTVQEAGQANQRTPDHQVLEFAMGQGRAVLTINRDDFIRDKHHQGPGAGCRFLISTYSLITEMADNNLITLATGSSGCVIGKG